MLIELILNLRFQVEALDATTLATALNAHDVIRRRKAIPYIPRTLLEEIEELRDKRNFEKEAYGVEVTPEWYCLERLAFRVSAAVVDLASKIVDLHEETFDRQLPQLIKKQKLFCGRPNRATRT